MAISLETSSGSRGVEKKTIFYVRDKMRFARDILEKMYVAKAVFTTSHAENGALAGDILGKMGTSTAGQRGQHGRPTSKSDCPRHLLDDCNERTATQPQLSKTGLPDNCN